ncbi:LysM peptidoglycan-binding domain-containing protein [Streptomyces melanogenes]|uniref:LysM peptidoglycan-binding domain-containing protein n=1 Tax=Streptomyces melanogenes TaxID=67326 RepID=UPI00167EAE11|nr:LysM peptidoglycan-binding domain-containing protein [Streptomyces melanogenes]GGP78171.1 membrane protein [Streptomyces melanogenes]
MRTTSSLHAASPGRTLVRVLTAVLGLLALVTTVIGLPLLLAWATPAIWAATHDDVVHLLDRQDTGAVFLLLLVTAGWAGWGQFTFCAVRELIAQVRGRAWHVPRGMGASQRAAALLIGSIVALLPTSAALASTPPTGQTATAARLPGQTPAPQATQTEDGTTPEAATAAASTTYTVRQTRPAQSLWGIAEQQLGDGERWREIAELNEGRTMADGTPFRANRFLQPGWQLRMPGTGKAAEGARTQRGDSTPAQVRGERAVTVHPGDSLSRIAAEELGDGNQWSRLFEVSRGTPQPHGLPAITNPDVIYPGQQVTVPGTQQPRHSQGHTRGDDTGHRQTAPPATQNPEAAQKPAQSPGDGAGRAPSQTDAPAPHASSASPPSQRPAQPGREQASPSTSTPTAPRARTTSPTTAPLPPAQSSSTPTSPPTAQGQATPATAPASSPLNQRTVLGAGALLAAAVTSALALRRTLQRRRRKPGETIAIAPQTSTAEAQLAAAADKDDAPRLDAALRTLAHHLAQRDDDTTLLPPLRAARIGTRTIEVLPEDQAQEPVAPFTAGQGGWWVLPADATLLDEEAAQDIPPPYPTLVTIGSTTAGDLLLLNLAQLPALLLDGTPLHITEVCTSLALELAMSPWAAGAEIVTVGFGEELPQLLPTARITHLRQATHALRDLSERLLETHQIPDTAHHPYVLLCASALGPDISWQFADLLDTARSLPVTLIAPANTACGHFPQAETLNASLNAPQTLDCTGTTITVQRLEHAAYQQIANALKASGQPPQPAAGAWKDVPDEPGAIQQTNPTPTQELPVPEATTSPGPKPTVTTEATDEVFPALLAATTNPSGIRLQTVPRASQPREAEAEPSAQAAAPRTPVSPTPISALTNPRAARGDTPAASGVQGGPPTVADRTAPDLHAPEIRVLGPVDVTGVDNTGHGPKLQQLAALLYFRPGRSAEVLCADMDPSHPWTTRTLNTRIQGLRSCLGSDPSGTLYVPRRKTREDPYQLAPSVRCDWSHFLRLSERALPMGPAGLADLEAALALVRGTPFGGQPPPWAEPLQQEMLTRIIDVAHTVTTHRTPQGPHHDLTAARHAIVTGLGVDESAEVLYRAWIRLEAACGNRSGLHTAITRVQHVNQTLGCSLETETEQLIDELLNARKA